MIMPLKYKTPAEFEAATNRYFELCDLAEPKVPYTITGLALAMGFSDKNALYDYAKKDDYKQVVNVARLRVENSYEVRLIQSSNAAGSIFALKNFGWKDKLELAGDPNAPVINRIERVIVQK